MRTAVVASVGVAVIASSIIVFSLPKKANYPSGQRTNLTVKRLPEQVAPASVMPVVPAIAASMPSKKAHAKPAAVAGIKPIDAFVYNPSEQTTSFECKQGTKISVQPKSFVDAETGADITTPVEISVKEFYKMEDILDSHLSTLSTEGLLETNGMVFIEASSNGKQCLLKEGAAMNIFFPKVNDKPGMQLYAGEKSAENTIIWKCLAYNPQILSESDEAVSRAAKSIEREIREREAAANERKKITFPPSYPGGIAAVRKYINSNIYVPGSLAEQWQGVMEVEFCISPFGTVEDVKVTKEINKECTAQVAVALLNMYFWKRGMKDGQPARYRTTLQILFRPFKREAYIAGFSKPFELAPYRKQDNVEGQGQEYFVFSSTKLGWINCDRPLNFPPPSTMLYVNAEGNSKQDVRMIFHNYKSVMPSSKEGGCYKFQKVPIGQPVTIFAVKYEPDGIYLAMKNTIISAGPVTDLTYIKVTPAQLKASYQQFDSLFPDTAMK